MDSLKPQNANSVPVPKYLTHIGKTGYYDIYIDANELPTNLEIAIFLTTEKMETNA